ncbi:MAG: indole-3-glycerol phosphate synthase [Clostridiales bacterium 43-6]|nr:MAG: indole-3-glycerol phosphate synthase [Clostridiales bacterium 43-6]
MILDEILCKRKDQLEKEKSKVSLEEIKQAVAAKQEPPIDFYQALSSEPLAVIAEVKKASPSKGVIRGDFYPVETAVCYEGAGVNAISVLTEEYYFQGSSEYLCEIRKHVKLPLLRKDFIFDEYQIYEARVMGADAVLLIAGVLDTETMKGFLTLAKSLGLHCLVEVHQENELEKAIAAGADIIGINNRDLTTFHVDLATTERLIPSIPKHCIIVSESGIATNADMKRLKAAGANAVLIGETLMRSGDVANSLKHLRADV